MSKRKPEIPIWHCPACGGQVADKTVRCPSCRFTGQDTIGLFGDTFPPMKSVMDFAQCWTDPEIHAIRKTMQRLRKRYPQLRPHAESIRLPQDASLSSYGMWRVNTAPLGTHETSVHRSWVLLLSVDTAKQRAAVTCGYRISHWLGDPEWKKVLEAMVSDWQNGRKAASVCSFWRQAERQIRIAWKQKGIP